MYICIKVIIFISIQLYKNDYVIKHNDISLYFSLIPGGVAVVVVIYQQNDF